VGRAWETPTQTVTRIVGETRAIQSWIDGRMEAGWTNEQIEAVLPHAAAFITGEISEGDLLALAQRAASCR
jgi:hypothetical protein